MSEWRFPFVRADVAEPARWLPYLRESYGEGRYSNFGPNVTALERESEELLGRSCVAVCNGTAGLVAALISVGRCGPVVLSPFTFPATAHAVLLAGCTPVFCDVDPATWELAPERIARAVEATHPVAVVHTRVFGLCRGLSDVEAACGSVPLIVDAAAALGGRPAGLAGSCEVFSLHATKAAAIGEGGIVAADDEVAAQIKSVINFAIVEDDVTGRGLNGKLDEFAAARGRAALATLERSISARRAFADAYGAVIAGRLARPVDEGAPAWQTYPVRTGGREERDALRSRLADRGVEARPYYTPALHRTTAFAQAASLPVAEELSESVLCLPVYADDDSATVDALAGLLRDAMDALP